jgi:hypothetical protein
MAASIACIAFPVCAQRGPAYPEPGADRGPAYPKNVSPTDTNPANWIVQTPEYTDPYGPNSKRYYRYYYGHHRRYR